MAFFLFCYAGTQETRLLELEFIIRAVGNTVAADTRYRSPAQPKSGVNLLLKVRFCETRWSAKARVRAYSREIWVTATSLEPPVAVNLTTTSP